MFEQKHRSSIPICWHNLVFRTIGYCAVALFLVVPMASLPGWLSAVCAVPIAICMSEIANRWKLRVPVAICLAVCVFLVGIAIEKMFATESVVSVLGVGFVLSVVSAVSFGILTFTIVFSLSFLSGRVPLLTVLEAVTVILLIVLSFAGHRNSEISQPKEFAEWALINGYDPRTLLRVIGIATCGLVGLLMVRTKYLKQSLLSFAALSLIYFGSFYVSLWVIPDRYEAIKPIGLVSMTDQGASSDKNAPHEQESLSFNPQDWPQQPNPVAVVTFESDYTPPLGSYYFRQNAFSQFNGGKLARSTRGDFDADLIRDFSVDNFQPHAVVPNAEIAIPLSMKISLLQQHTNPFALVSPVSYSPQRNSDPKTFERTYRIESQVLTVGELSPKVVGRKSGDLNWVSEEREHYLSGPADPRYRELADEILKANRYDTIQKEFRDSDVLRALTIRRWIEENIVYSRNLSETLDDRPPVETFLFETRRGYCVHIAHAMAFLLRSVGIPSRVAGGYLVEAARMGQGDGLIIVASDMHAWCEIYIDGLGWMVMDAITENSESSAPPPVDPVTQAFYNERNREPFEPADPSEWPDRNDSERKHASNWYLVFFVLLGGLFPYAVKIWRRAVPIFAPSEHLYRLTYRAVADQVAEVGLWRRFGESTEEFAARVESKIPGFYTLASAHLRQAMTGEVREDRAFWNTRYRLFGERLKKSYSRRQRILGWLNPFSWLRVR